MGTLIKFVWYTMQRSKKKCPRTHQKNVLCTNKGRIETIRKCGLCVPLLIMNIAEVGRGTLVKICLMLVRALFNA